MSYQARITRFCQVFEAAPQKEILLSRTLFRAAALLEQRINEALVPCNMSMPQYLAMAMLLVDEGNQPTNPSEVSKLLDMTRTQVTRLMDSLETEGWVTRTLDKEDRRRMMLTLTDEGKAKLKMAAPVVHAVYQRAWSVFDDAGQDHVANELAHLYEGLEKEVA
ncbi:MULTISPECIES: MarR family winged helix-turn-helix transcriptional regulator [Silvimonas]|uniref:MarR family winged helix-turn-helix transcriptional regulator n=1 Tax=Silvimonas TaxID=300264 RepID=UPI0024B32E2A|nr:MULTISPECIES: MarR family transcriptional regulator [Silvimonas]MDR3426734.1 winged helix DNA-binding protein [Silvimonas sp.]